MAGGGNGLGDAFQRVAQRAQMQVAVDPTELLASLNPSRGAPAAHVGQEHPVLNGPTAVRTSRPACSTSPTPSPTPSARPASAPPGCCSPGSAATKNRCSNSPSKPWWTPPLAKKAGCSLRSSVTIFAGGLATGRTVPGRRAACGGCARTWAHRFRAGGVGRTQRRRRLGVPGRGGPRSAAVTRPNGCAADRCGN